MKNEIQIFNHEEFGNVRVLEQNGEPWFVGKDMAEALGYSNPRDALAKHVDDEDKGASQIATPYGVQNMTIINESGMYALIFGSQLPAAKKFKHWVTAEVLPSIRKTGSYSVKPKVPTPVADMIADIGAVADAIQARFAVKDGVALSQAIDLVGAHRNFDSLHSLKQLLPPAEHETGYLNATQIGERLGLGTGTSAGRRANVLLKNAAFQYREGRSWRLTDEGLPYGEEMPYTRNGHSGYQIRWNENIIEALMNVA